MQYKNFVLIGRHNAFAGIRTSKNKKIRAKVVSKGFYGRLKLLRVMGAQRAEPPFLSEALPESRQLFEATAARTSGLVNLVFSRQTGFSSTSVRLVTKPMVIIEPAVP